MGLIAARRTREILSNSYYILGFELLCACQAAEQRGDVSELSSSTAETFRLVREGVPYFDYDEPLTDSLEFVAELIESGKLLNALPENTKAFEW